MRYMWVPGPVGYERLFLFMCRAILRVGVHVWSMTTLLSRTQRAFVWQPSLVIVIRSKNVPRFDCNLNFMGVAGPSNEHHLYGRM
jgi:hypothetical protein